LLEYLQYIRSLWTRDGRAWGHPQPHSQRPTASNLRVCEQFTSIFPSNWSIMPILDHLTNNRSKTLSLSARIAHLPVSCFSRLVSCLRGEALQCLRKVNHYAMSQVYLASTSLYHCLHTAMACSCSGLAHMRESKMILLLLKEHVQELEAHLCSESSEYDRLEKTSCALRPRQKTT